MTKLPRTGFARLYNASLESPTCALLTSGRTGPSRLVLRTAELPNRTQDWCLARCDPHQS